MKATDPNRAFGDYRQSLNTAQERQMIDMARIDSPSIQRVEDIGSSTLLFTIVYTAVFNEFTEIGLEFDDAAKLWEDDPNDDDQITPYPVPQRFRADNHTVVRTHQITATKDMLNTELGDEEIKAQIWLRRVGGVAADDEKFTIGTVTLDP